MKKYFDLTPVLGPATPAWPTDPPVVFTEYKSTEKGGSSNVAQVSMGSHAGCHIDAPRHFFSGGTPVDELSLDVLMGPALVVGTDAAKVDYPVLKALTGGQAPDRLLLKTGNSRLWSRSDFVREFVGMTVDAARYLVESGTKLVGIDYLSIEAEHGPGETVHQILLRNNIVIVEGLNMSDISPGRFELYCLPLKLAGLDGAPARVVVSQTD